MEHRAAICMNYRHQCYSPQKLSRSASESSVESPRYPDMHEFFLHRESRLGSGQFKDFSHNVLVLLWHFLFLSLYYCEKYIAFIRSSSQCVIIVTCFFDRQQRRFLVIDEAQFILVEPDTTKLGWGVVKFVARLQVTGLSSLNWRTIRHATYRTKVTTADFYKISVMLRALSFFDRCV